MRSARGSNRESAGPLRFVALHLRSGLSSGPRYSAMPLDAWRAVSVLNVPITVDGQHRTEECSGRNAIF